MQKILSVIKTIARGHEINKEDYPTILEALNGIVNGDYAGINCPHCGCSEMLCGHNGSGCSHDTEDTDDGREPCTCCGESFSESSYDSDMCDNCIELKADDIASNKGETY